MPSPEYPFQAPIFFAPDTKAGGNESVNPESTEHSSLPDAPDIDNMLSSTVSAVQPDVRGLSNAIDSETQSHPTGYLKEEAFDSDADDESVTIWPPGPTDIVYGDLGLQRDRDLSHNANWLLERLLCGAVDYGEELDYLQWRADKEGIDLQAAIYELDSHQLLVRRRPGWIDLPRKATPHKGKM